MARGYWVPIVGLVALSLGSVLGCQSASGPGASLRKLVDNASGNSALVNAQRMENAEDASARRQGIIYLSSFDYGRKPPFTTRYQEIAVSDPDPLVRVAAIRALVVSGNASATDTFVKTLSDPHELVRKESAAALDRFPSEAAVPGLMKLAEPSAAGATHGQDARIAAVSALRHYRRVDVARALAGLLDDPAFGVAWTARRSLAEMTGKDLAFVESDWLEFITGPDQPLG